MESREQGLQGSLDAQALQQVLGYLNFSSGTSDPQFLAALNQLFAQATNEPPPEPTWRVVHAHLVKALDQLEGASTVFADVQQARHVLSLLAEFCPAYRQYHRDLLAHQSEGDLFNSFLFGRAAEVILGCGPGWERRSEVLTASIRRLNDYLGYRPVATLESQKIEPYEHEWVRPVPLYIADAGEAVGPYQPLVRACLKCLRETDEQLLEEAYFDPNRLEELAMDPRAYDFEHPANKRPNHHFGQWDMHRIDNKGFYRRFVVQQVTLDALLRRVEETDELVEERLTEAAAVLAGTILMASGISGYGPETHDSTVSLSSLLVKIAAYRDAFYEQLLHRVKGKHGTRLRREAKQLQQPLAGARQDLNRELTQRRATQLQRVQLAKLYARMGYAEAAEEQTAYIQVPAARLTCQIDCLLVEARSRTQANDFGPALECLERARQILLRGIECGAIVDPWNILGFDGNFSLFGALENSLRDYRIDELVELIEEMLELYARLWSAAAANENREIAEQTSVCFEAFANWWHQFAAHELDLMETEDPRIVHRAAQSVAEALEAWHARGEASGDIGFWAPHVQKFDSCRAYGLVVNTLLSRDDKVAALGLLMNWLSQSDRIPLEYGETSFFQLSLRWLAGALHETGAPPTEKGAGWRRIRRFFDYLDANAGDFWHVPQFVPEGQTPSVELETASDVDALDAEDPEESDEQIYGAAYENVVYRDSTDDGVEGDVFDFESHDEDYLQQVSRPIVDRLAFLEQLASMWKLVAVAWSTAETTNAPDATDQATSASMHDLLEHAVQHMSRSSGELSELLDAVSGYRLAHPSGDPESMVHYDRLRLLKDSLTDQIINTQVQVIEGLQFLLAAVDTTSQAPGITSQETLGDEDRQAVELLRATLRGEGARAADIWDEARQSLSRQPILYIPITRGGSPRTIVRVKARQKLMQNLLNGLPRLGLLKETYELIELARDMERRLPPGSGAITEFDDLFEAGCRAMVTALIEVLEPEEHDDPDGELWLMTHLEEMMEPLLRSWLAHSRTLRLSVLEQVLDNEQWEELVEFVKQFGRDLFTQRFLNLGNVRGILHQGVENWLKHLQEYPADDAYQGLLDALENGLDLGEAVEKLTLILEAVVESYAEYRDYNSTTTQSDRGDLLYALLDFLRLRTSYDRVLWNLRPIITAHQVLASHGCQAAADRWRTSLKQRIGSEAQRHVRRLHELQKTYAMRLPSVSERLNERFMRPLLIDRLCALIRPAIHSEDPDARHAAFEGIREQAEAFLSEPSGAGLDLPTWLLAMEEEVRAAKDDEGELLDQLMVEFALPATKLTLAQLQSQVAAWQ